MRNFIINKSDELKKTLLVTALTYVNPVTYLHEIENEVLNSSEGKLIIDLLTCNNGKPYRFLSVDIIEGELDESSFRIEDELLSNSFIYEADRIIKLQANLSNNYLVSRTKKRLIANS